MDSPTKTSKHALSSRLEISETRDKKARSPRLHPPRSRSDLQKSEKDNLEVSRSRKEGEKKVEFVEESTSTTPRTPRTPRGSKVKGRKVLTHSSLFTLLFSSLLFSLIHSTLLFSSHVTFVFVIEFLKLMIDVCL